MAMHTLTSGLDVKEIQESGAFSGYGSVFGVKDLGNDIVERGAFTNALMQRGVSGVKLLWQHDPATPIGVFDKIEEDERGLYVEGKLLIDAVEKAREVYALVRAGVVDGLSIGFRTIKGKRDTLQGRTVRRLLEVDLWEISLVTFPMQPDARIADVKSQREFERFLRDEGGLSRREATAFMSGGFDGLKKVRDSRQQTDMLTALQRMQQRISS